MFITRIYASYTKFASMILNRAISAEKSQRTVILWSAIYTEQRRSTDKRKFTVSHGEIDTRIRRHSTKNRSITNGCRAMTRCHRQRVHISSSFIRYEPRQTAKESRADVVSRCSSMRKRNVCWETSIRCLYSFYGVSPCPSDPTKVDLDFQ